MCGENLNLLAYIGRIEVLFAIHSDFDFYGILKMGNEYVRIIFA